MTSLVANFCAGLALLSLNHVRAADQPLPADVLHGLQSATVLVKVSHGSQQSSGSGFVVLVERDRGYIVTNAHVCPLVPETERAKQQIKVVLNSGTPAEREASAEIVAESVDADLAVLKLTARDLPKGLSLSSPAALRETLPVFVLGFPFGTGLSIHQGNPTVTISGATISSLRCDANKELCLIQLDGNLNPGNSGGPVVDQKGELVGISVARIENAGIGFAIPSQTLAAVLKGDVDEIVFENGTADGKPALKAQCRLLDPFEKVKSISVSLAPAPAAKTGKPSGGQTDNKPNRVALQRAGQMAEATIPVNAGEKNQDFEATVELVLADDSVVKKTPFKINLKSGLLDGKSFRAALFVSAGAKALVAQTGHSKEAAKRADFGGEVQFMAPAADGSGMFVLKKSEGTTRLHFWNPVKNELGPEISVPRSPSHLALQGDRLFVTCPDSNVVAILDSNTKKIVSAIELDLPEQLRPSRVACASSAEFAYVLCSPNGEKPKGKTAVVEIDLKSSKYTKLTSGDIEYAAVAKNTLVCQTNFGGSPSGMPPVLSIDDLRPAESKKRPGGGEHADFGPYGVTANGCFVYGDHEDKTHCVSADRKDTLWNADGVVLAAWPDQSAFLITSGARNTNTDKWPIKAVDQMGSTLWEQTIALESPISMWITQALPVNNSPPFLIIGTARQGSSVSFAVNNTPLGITRSYVLAGKESNYVVFSVSQFTGEIVGRSAFRVNEKSRTWFYAPIPARKESPKIPDQIFVGEKFEFQPDVPVTENLYSLKSGPPGMLCDAKSAQIQWQPEISSLGTYDVEIVKTENGKETSVLKFAIRVKSKRS